MSENRSLPRQSDVRHCDSCERSIALGEVYYEVLTARRIHGQAPPRYAAKTYLCEECEHEEAVTGCPCVGTPEQEECPHA